MKIHDPMRFVNTGDDIFGSQYRREGAMHLRTAGSRSYSSCVGAGWVIRAESCMHRAWAYECIELEMTVAAASATLVAHFGPPRCMFGRLRLHSACINPRDRPREAPPSAMSNAARGLAAEPRTAAQGRDGESREKDWKKPTKERERGGRRKKCQDRERHYAEGARWRSERRDKLVPIYPLEVASEFLLHLVLRRVCLKIS